MSGAVDTVVIGAGLNGLVAATALARSGRKVLVVERRDTAGGTAATEEFFPGFRADTGLHDIGWLAPPVAALMNPASAGVEFLAPDPWVSVPLPEGGLLSLRRDPAASAAAIRPFAPADAEAWPEFCRLMHRLAGFLAGVALAPAPRPTDLSPSNLLALAGIGRRVRALGRHDMTELLRTVPMSAEELLSDRFGFGPLKAAVAAGGLQHLLQGPRSGGTAFTLLHHHVGAGAGIFRGRGLVRGGAGRLAEAFLAAARAAGVEVRLGAEAAAIPVERGRVAGVALASGETIPAARVLSSADPRRTLLGLLPGDALEPELAHAISRIKCRGAMVKVNLALGELPAFRGAGSGVVSAPAGLISFAPDLDTLERAFDDAKHGRPSARPAVEAFLPTLHDPSLAPAGRHVLTAWAQFSPYRSGTGAADPAAREAFGDAVVRVLAEAAPNLPGAILHRQVLLPADLESRFGATEGNLYHGEMTLDQILFMRPAGGWSRHRTPVGGLYLCGSGTHPGGSLPGVAGWLAAREAARDKGAAA